MPLLIFFLLLGGPAHIVLVHDVVPVEHAMHFVRARENVKPFSREP